MIEKTLIQRGMVTNEMYPKNYAVGKRKNGALSE